MDVKSFDRRCWVMSERQISMMCTEDVSNSVLSSDHKGPQVVCYAVQGNVVDRATGQGGKGWCEGVSPTLNTQNHHAVCYAIYDARGNGEGCVVPTITGDHENRITDYTSVVIIDHSRRHNYQPIDVVPTMEAHMGTGGGNVPLILMEINK